MVESQFTNQLLMTLLFAVRLLFLLFNFCYMGAFCLISGETHYLDLICN